MASTIIDSRIFGDMFSDSRMRDVWSDENRTAKYLEIERALAKVQGELGIIPKEAADEIVRNCELSQIDWDKLKAKTEQIGYPDHCGGQPDQRQLPRQARRVLPLGRHHAGHYRYGRGAADARRPRAGGAGPGRDCRRAGRAGKEVPRHAGHRPLEPAAGHADHLRLQDGQHPRRHRPAPRAPAAAQAARADGGVRRRLGHLVVAGEGRDGNPGRADEGTGPGPAPDLVAHGARHHCRGGRLPGPGGRLARQDRDGHQADDADRGGRSVRALRAGPRFLFNHAAEAQPDLLPPSPTSRSPASMPPP